MAYGGTLSLAVWIYRLYRLNKINVVIAMMSYGHKCASIWTFCPQRSVTSGFLNKNDFFFLQMNVVFKCKSGFGTEVLNYINQIW